MTDTTQPHPLFTRERTPFTLEDGTEVQLQKLNLLEQELVHASDPGARYLATVVFYGLVDPKPATIDQAFEAGDALIEISNEIHYISGMAERPGADGAADEVVEGTEEDPLVDEFPDAEDAPLEGVDGAPGDVSGLREAVGGSPGGGVAGDVPVHDGGRGSTGEPEGSS